MYADTSGRFDHIMGNINTLYKSDKIIESIQVIVFYLIIIYFYLKRFSSIYQILCFYQVIQLASNSLTWILKPGFHNIIIPKILVQTNSWCGLLPIGAPVNCIVTTGLKWNLSMY